MIFIHVDTESPPRINRGAALQWSPVGGRPWSSLSYHENAAEALAAYSARPHWWDSDPAHYRIDVHHLDHTGETQCAPLKT